MKVLNFREFELSINEAEQIDETVTLTAQIMSTFFDVYSFILPSATGYPDIIKDVQSMVEGDANDKEKAMEEIKKSILGAVDEDAKKTDFYRDAETAFGLVIGSYNKMIIQFEKDKDTVDLKKVAGEVAKSAVRFLDSLKDSKKSLPEIKESADNMGYEDINEAIKSKKGRKETMSIIVSTKGNIDSKMDEPGTLLKPTITKLSSELDSIAKKVGDDKYWQGMKRRDRNKELEDITNRISQIPVELSDQKDKIFKSMDSNKDSISELTKAIELLKKATDSKEKFTAKKIEDANKEDTKKEENKEDTKKEEAKFEDIDPKDPDNMKKVGKNRDAIILMQELTNKMFADEKGYKKIDTDGLYGKNTTEAFKKAQDFLNKLGAGLNTEGKLSASVQQAFNNFINNKDQISKMIKNDK